jgi:hypothetical protein
MIWNNQVLVCGGSSNTKCFSYGIKTGVWNPLSSITTNTHTFFPGSAYQDKLYLAHNLYPDIVDPNSNSVTSWPVLPISGKSGCMVTWKDTFIYFGGEPYFNTTFQYSHVSNNWTILSSTTELKSSSCVVLPNQNVLIAGSSRNSDATRYVVYNVSSNSWLPKTFGSTPHYNSVAILLGKRVFTIAGYNINDIEEYHYDNNTVSRKSFKLITARSGTPSAVALPAYLFSHLPQGCVGVL